MSEPRSVVVTGASRGLGLASAAHLYRLGWRVVGAMRSPEVGLERLRAETGASDDDPRLIGVRLDLQDPCRLGFRRRLDAPLAVGTHPRHALGDPIAVLFDARRCWRPW